MDKDVIQRRLRTVEGHIRGIDRMVGEDAYCIDVLRQIQAVRAALGKISTSILDDHLHSCLITVVRGEDPAERERVLSEIAEVFSAAAES
ncbi:MAG TPA: metal-sensitive transcriptional regulator [Anaerolineales bacterium]|nr:metal-sensitive transcriptional regulator [Anaerolineales bacterium]